MTDLIVGSVVLCHLHLHELGDVESEADGCHRDDVDQQPLGVGHGLGDGSSRHKHCIKRLIQSICLF